MEPRIAELTFLFLHGAGGQHGTWAPQTRALNVPPWSAMAVDLPGRGRAPGPGRACVPDYAHDVEVLIEALGPHRLVLCGLSLGGAIALQVAINGRVRLAGLGLVATGAKLRVMPAFLEALASNFDGAARAAGVTAFGPDAADATRDQLVAELRASGQAICLSDFRACDAFDVRDQLDRISVPACVICGTNDQLTPPRYSTFLHEHLRRGELHLEPGPGHVISLEAPDVVTSILRDFGRLLLQADS